MTLRNRLAQLEKRTAPPASNPYMTMPVQELLARAWEAVQRGDPPTQHEVTPEGEAMRADILRRLERIAEAQHEQP